MRKIVVFLVFVCINFNCINNPDRILNRAIIQYKKGDKTKISVIEQAVLKKVSTSKYSEEFNKSNNYLYKKSSGDLKIIYPFEKKIKNMSTGEIKSFDYDENYFAVTDGEKIEVLDLLEDEKNEFKPEKKNSDIKSIAILEDLIIYYARNKLHTYEKSSSSHGYFVKDSFIPPYKKLYNAVLNKHNNFISLLLGIAGSYYLSVININNNDVHIKNISLSSSKYFMDENNIYYISGNSGKWKLYRFSVMSKSKKYLKSFKDLIDIEFTSKGYIFQNSKGLFISEYTQTGKSIKIPFNYRLLGKCNDHVLIENNGTTYLVELKSLIDNLTYLKEVIPDIFKSKKTSKKY